MRSRLSIMLGAAIVAATASIVTALTVRQLDKVGRDSAALAALQAAQSVLRDHPVEATFRAGLAVGQSDATMVLASAAEIVAASSDFELANQLLATARQHANDSDRPLIEAVESRIERLRTNTRP